MDTIRGTVFRQVKFAEFEKLTHERVESGGALTADWMSEQYYQLVKQYFGNDIVADEEIAIEWARIPHFYRAFYVYQYATGFAAATALGEAILEEGEPAVKRYLHMLQPRRSRLLAELAERRGRGHDEPRADFASDERVRVAAGRAGEAERVRLAASR